MNQPILTEEEIRQRMSDISRRYPEERRKLREAYSKLCKREAQVQLAITFLEDKLLYKQDAKDYVRAAKENGTKLTVADKEALILLELETEKIEYDLAKFDVETTDKDFNKLEPQLSYYQSEMRLQ